MEGRAAGPRSAAPAPARAVDGEDFALPEPRSAANREALWVERVLREQRNVPKALAAAERRHLHLGQVWLLVQHLEISRVDNVEGRIAPVALPENVLAELHPPRIFGLRWDHHLDECEHELLARWKGREFGPGEAQLLVQRLLWHREHLAPRPGGERADPIVAVVEERRLAKDAARAEYVDDGGGILQGGSRQPRGRRGGVLASQMFEHLVDHGGLAREDDVEQLRAVALAEEVLACFVLLLGCPLDQMEEAVTVERAACLGRRRVSAVPERGGRWEGAVDGRLRPCGLVVGSPLTLVSIPLTSSWQSAYGWRRLGGLGLPPVGVRACARGRLVVAARCRPGRRDGDARGGAGEQPRCAPKHGEAWRPPGGTGCRLYSARFLGEVRVPSLLWEQLNAARQGSRVDSARLNPERRGISGVPRRDLPSQSPRDA